MKTSNGKSRRSATGTRASAASSDAIALLKADHRQVEGWFGQFDKTRSTQRKQDLAAKICGALRVHTTIEEEIFYPAFLEATGDKDLHHEAIVEHQGAKDLIAQIESMDADDDYYDAKVSVLSEMIKHHVKEEEQPGGLFAKAKQSDMDLQALAERMQTRKQELQKGPKKISRSSRSTARRTTEKRGMLGSLMGF